MRWRPISTAPKDGTFVMLAEPAYVGTGSDNFPGGYTWNVCWGRWVDVPQEENLGGGKFRIPPADPKHDGKWVAAYAAIYSGGESSWHLKPIILSPTHWMPVPESPSYRTLLKAVG